MRPMRLIVVVASLLIACGSSSKPARSGTEGGEGATVTVEQVDGLGDPIVEIHNTANKPAQVTFVGATEVSIDVAALSSNSVKLPPGTYSARVSGAGATPADWPMTFDSDRRYRITLKVGLAFDDPLYAGKGMYCYEVPSGRTYFLCARTMERCVGQKAKTPPTMQTSSCAYESECSGSARGTGRAGGSCRS